MAVTLTRRVAADQLMRAGCVLDRGPLSELPLPGCQRGGGGGGATEEGGGSRMEPGEAAGGRSTTRTADGIKK